MTSVSYTHLDVYKRQRQKKAIPIEDLCLVICEVHQQLVYDKTIININASICGDFDFE